MQLLARTTPGSLTGFHQAARQSQQELQTFISFLARHQSSGASGTCLKHSSALQVKKAQAGP
jgi:hypothetical protein